MMQVGCFHGVLFSGCADLGANAGFGSAFSGFVPTDTLSSVGSQLCFLLGWLFFCVLFSGSTDGGTVALAGFSSADSGCTPSAAFAFVSSRLCFLRVGYSCGVLFSGNANNGASAGFSYANSNNAPSLTNANVSSQL